jgi:hypothetical protein
VDYLSDLAGCRYTYVIDKGDLDRFLPWWEALLEELS